MFPQAAGRRIMRVQVCEVTGNRERLTPPCGEREDTAHGMFLDEKIARSKRQIILWNDASILEAIPGVQVAHDDTMMTIEIPRSQQREFPYFQPDHQMRRILKLIACIAPEVGNMPAHAEWRQRAQDSAGVEFPTVVRIIQVPMWGKIIVRDHHAFFYPVLPY